MITKPSIFDTQLGVQTNMRSQVMGAMNFLLTNSVLVDVPDRDINLLKTMRNFGNSKMFSLFDTIVNANKLDVFKFFDFTRVVSNSIPEILTLGALTIDGSNLDIQSGDHLKKVWCNITPYVKKRKMASEKLEVSDVDKIHELVVRGALCKSYNESRLWLTPDIAAMIIESYAITISNILSNSYKLDFQDSSFITLIYAMYYAQLFNLDSSMEDPPLLLKCKRLNKMGIDIVSTNSINRVRKDPNKLLTLHEISSIIAEHGPYKMRSFGTHTLSSLFARGSVDIQLMLIALEYPPYYVTQLIRLADNYKNQVLFSNPNNKKDAPLLIELLRTTNTFIPKL